MRNEEGQTLLLLARNEKNTYIQRMYVQDRNQEQNYEEGNKKKEKKGR